MNPDVAAAVKARADGYCEACGGRLGVDGGVLHHRLLRKHGGEDTLENLIEVHWVCHNGHTNSIHSRVERSYRLHHLVKFADDPALSTATITPNLLRLRQ